MGMLGMGVWLATWMLVGQVTMPQGTVTQEVRAFPSVEACEQTRQQMVKTVGRQHTTMQVTDLQTGQPATVQYAIVWSCQRSVSQ